MTVNSLDLTGTVRGQVSKLTVTVTVSELTVNSEWVSESGWVRWREFVAVSQSVSVG